MWNLDPKLEHRERGRGTGELSYRKKPILKPTRTSKDKVTDQQKEEGSSGTRAGCIKRSKALVLGLCGESAMI